MGAGGTPWKLTLLLPDPAPVFAILSDERRDQDSWVAVAATSRCKAMVVGSAAPDEWLLPAERGCGGALPKGGDDGGVKSAE